MHTAKRCYRLCSTVDSHWLCLEREMRERELRLSIPDLVLHGHTHIYNQLIHSHTEMCTRTQPSVDMLCCALYILIQAMQSRATYQTLATNGPATTHIQHMIFRIFVWFFLSSLLYTHSFALTGTLTWMPQLWIYRMECIGVRNIIYPIQTHILF